MSELLTPTQKSWAVYRLAKAANPAAVLNVDYTFGPTQPDPDTRPTKEQGETSEAYRTRVHAWREANPPTRGIQSWDEDKLGPPPTTAEIEAEAAKTPVPPRITRRQFHLAAYSLGITRDTILALIDAIEDETQRNLALIDYEQSTSFERNWPLLVQMATALGLTSEQVDEAFRQGSTL